MSEEQLKQQERNNSPCLSVVIPVYNEAATLAAVVRKVLLIPHLLEIVVVDDCSTDGTSEVARSIAERDDQRVRVTRHERNSGKTEALKTGFALTSGEIVIVQDADLEYDPTEIPGVIQPILDGHADVVFGSRFLVRRAARVLYFYHYVANKVADLPFQHSHEPQHDRRRNRLQSVSRRDHSQHDHRLERLRL